MPACNTVAAVNPKILVQRRLSYETRHYRLGNQDILLRSIQIGPVWILVICIPDGRTPGKWHTWKEHVLLYAHGTTLTMHRGGNPTFNIARRIGWWVHLARDVERFLGDCPLCIRNRHKPSPAIMHARGRSVDDRAHMHPWSDVIIDVQGPLTQSKKGYRYLLSYQCTFLEADP